MESMTVTWTPDRSATVVRTKWEPMNPAPPVTSRRMRATLPPGPVADGGPVRPRPAPARLRESTDLGELVEHLRASPGLTGQGGCRPRHHGARLLGGQTVPQLPQAQHLGVQAGPVEHRHVRQPQPDQEHDDAGKRPVRAVEVTEVRGIDAEARGP